MFEKLTQFIYSLDADGHGSCMDFKNKTLEVTLRMKNGVRIEAKDTLDEEGVERIIENIKLQINKIT